MVGMRSIIPSPKYVLFHKNKNGLIIPEKTVLFLYPLELVIGQIRFSWEDPMIHLNVNNLMSSGHSAQGFHH